MRIRFFHASFSGYRVPLFQDVAAHPDVSRVEVVHHDGYGVAEPLRVDLGGGACRLEVRTSRTLTIPVPSSRLLFWPATMTSGGAWDAIVLPWDPTQALLVPAVLHARRHGSIPLLWGHGPDPEVHGKRRLKAFTAFASKAAGLMVYAMNDLEYPVATREVGNSLDARSWETALRDSEVQALRERYAPNDEPVVLFVSRVQLRRRLDVALRALADTRVRGSRARLVLIGDAAQDDSTLAVARSLGIEDRVHMLGDVRDPGVLRSWHALASACVYPAAGGLGPVLSAGHGLRPLVLSGARHGPEVALLGRMGALLSCSSVEEFVRALRGIVVHDSGQGRLEASVRNRVQEYFRPSAHAARLVSAISELIK